MIKVYFVKKYYQRTLPPREVACTCTSYQHYFIVKIPRKSKENQSLNVTTLEKVVGVAARLVAAPMAVVPVKNVAKD